MLECIADIGIASQLNDRVDHRVVNQLGHICPYYFVLKMMTANGRGYELRLLIVRSITINVSVIVVNSMVDRVAWR